MCDSTTRSYLWTRCHLTDNFIIIPIIVTGPSIFLTPNERSTQAKSDQLEWLTENYLYHNSGRLYHTTLQTKCELLRMYTIVTKIVALAILWNVGDVITRKCGICRITEWMPLHYKDEFVNHALNIKEWRISLWWLVKHHARWDWIHHRSDWTEHCNTQKIWKNLKF